MLSGRYCGPKMPESVALDGTWEGKHQMLPTPPLSQSEMWAFITTGKDY